VGKSFVACALAQKACRDGYAALYTRAQSLFRDLRDGARRGQLTQFASPPQRVDLLVIDDWAMAPLSEPERRDFWDLRGSLSGSFDDPDLATAGIAVA